MLTNKKFIFSDGDIVQARFADVAESFGLQGESTIEPPETNNENPSASSSQQCKTVLTWTEEQTHLLLSLYRSKMEEIGPLKRYRNKKQMWESISQEIAQQLDVSFTPSQVENRFKNVSKKNKDVMKNNRTSGSSIVQTPYDKDMAHIAAIDDSIEPEIIMTPTYIRRKPKTDIIASQSKKRRLESGSSENTADNTDEDPASPTPTTSHTKRGNMKDLNAQLLEEYREECKRKAEREQQKVNRHREKMDKLNRLTDILQDISKKIK